jgi:predicted dinucleotide-binding enzyme
LNIGIIGSGIVGTTLASGFLKHGHQVMIGTREGGKLVDWAGKNPKGRVGNVEETAKFGEVIVLAVKGGGALAALQAAGSAQLNGKTIIDACNPIADALPVNGVLQFYTQPNESLMESLQKQFKNANFVKAFNSVGASRMVDPIFKAGKPTMFICGNSDAAKKTVTSILDAFGWETADMGTAEAARAIEPLCMLWCIPGFRNNQWTHAFKLLIE